MLFLPLISVLSFRLFPDRAFPSFHHCNCKLYKLHSIQRTSYYGPHPSFYKFFFLYLKMQVMFFVIICLSAELTAAVGQLRPLLLRSDFHLPIKWWCQFEKWNSSLRPFIRQSKSTAAFALILPQPLFKKGLGSLPLRNAEMFQCLKLDVINEELTREIKNSQWNVCFLIEEKMEI